MVHFNPQNPHNVTIKDIEDYLIRYRKFITPQYERSLSINVEGFFLEHNKNIIDTISSIETIELVVRDIREDTLRRCCSPGNSKYILTEKKIRSNIDPKNLFKKFLNWTILDTIVYRIDFQNPHVNINGYGPYISFYKLQTSRPMNLKKGDRVIFKNNIIGGDFMDTDLVCPKVYFWDLDDLKLSDPRCFVVTTTMGHSQHHIVEDFRDFRDSVLKKYWLGRNFIKIYYSIGPFLSRILVKSPFLMTISRKLILSIHSRYLKR